MSALFLQGNSRDVLRGLPADYVHCAVTSPPYFGLRKYSGGEEVWGGDKDCQHEWGDTIKVNKGTLGNNLDTLVGSQTARIAKAANEQGQFCSVCGAWRGQLGAEPNPELYTQHLIEIMREVRRVLRPDGVFYLNIGDSWAANRSYQVQQTKWQGMDGQEGTPSRIPDGCKPLDMVLIPEQLALVARADGWYVRSILIWAKGVSLSDEYNGNSMPESVDGWKFTKHRVKIGQYEKMRRLWESKHSDQDWPFDLQGMSEGEAASSETPVSVRGQVSGDDESIRAITRGQGETQGTIAFRVGETQQGQVRVYREGQGNTSKGYQGVLPKPKGESQSEDERQEAGAYSAQSGTTERVPQEVCSGGEGQGDDGNEERSSVFVGNGYPKSVDGGTVVADSQGQPLSVSLLRNGGQNNIRPCDAVEQGWEAHNGQCGSSLPELQQQEGRQDSNDVIDCPGCPKCFPRGGLILRKGSWRPTDSYEHILMLTKTNSYFCDREAVLERGSNNSHGGGQSSAAYVEKATGQVAGWGVARPAGNGGRNLRSVLMIPTVGFKGAHFAVFPPRLIEPLIKSATSEKGCCPNCGSPWARVINHQVAVPKDCPKTIDAHLARGGFGQPVGTMGESGSGRIDGYTTTIGWLPTCQCAIQETEPCRVLDPFSGAGTTSLVCERLGLDSIGIDTSAEYIQLAEARIAEDEQKRIDEQIKQLRKEAKLASKSV